MGRKSQNKSLSQLLNSPLLLAERASIVLLDPKAHAALTEEHFYGAIQIKEGFQNLSSRTRGARGAI